jgi:hypothetical protein
VRTFAFIAAAGHVAVMGFAAFAMLFVATFPWENQSPEDAASDNWLLVAAPLVLGLAIAFSVAIFVQRVPVAIPHIFLAAEFGVAAVVLRYALGKSDHSDGKLLLVAVAAAATGIGAGIAAHRHQGSFEARASHR